MTYGEVQDEMLGARPQKYLDYASTREVEHQAM